MQIERIDIDMGPAEGVISKLKQRAISRKAVSKMARFLSPKVRAAAPKRSGALKQAQGVKTANSKRNKTGAYAVQGSRKKVTRTFTPRGRTKPITAIPAFYDHLVEQGTHPHSLSAGARKGRRIKRKKGDKVTLDFGQGGAQHPGARAAKFRERTWAANKDAVVDIGLKAMTEATNEVLRKEARKLLGLK